MRLARAYGNQQREGQLLIELGRIHTSTGDQSAATTAWRQAVTVLHGLFPNDETIALDLLAKHSTTTS